MIEIIGANLSDTLEKSKFERLMSCTSTEKRERIRRFHEYKDALRTLIGDILIRYMLCQRLKIKNQELVFGVNEFGKLFLRNYDDVEFNISHSGEWVVCSIDNLPIGIDIEQIKPIDMSIAGRFFSKEEVKSLMGKDIVEREDYFYDLWTLKESYIKAIGEGLSMPLDSFTIRIKGDNISVHSILQSDNYYFKQYHIDNDYKMALCSRKNEFPRNINLINVNDLFEEILLL
ncbi:MAG: 4'-phosphopantetheinyl transferase family protein [Ruminiclostridium sp.]